MINTPPLRRAGRQKRPRVPDALRKRAARTDACLDAKTRKDVLAPSQIVIPAFPLRPSTNQASEL
ncbi:hypothetical protein BDQ94DRAFT_154768 [Aspergillus welwitschiae]|uniref:Uncharacterized protein n=1 Tax=Aspergillus welwitschiae TaxID=1341132 RepID=A0A3F3PJS3_9EURO|nr:hypothetical protein BDQ94DRAFT_154768 [Aspergillus welwitschiae]RDH26972.1 hypothetical protein BDQ94DRAFT_154768 [Aspergillus welwitschiae]